MPLLIELGVSADVFRGGPASRGPLGRPPPVLLRHLRLGSGRLLMQPQGHVSVFRNRAVFYPGRRA